jgi:hypothetical protein
MQYLLVKNKQMVLLGPMHWKQRFIQSEMDELEVNYVVPPVEQGYIKITDDLEIFPIVEANMPLIDQTFECHVGPFYEYVNNEAKMTYNSRILNDNDIKHNLKELASDARYKMEIAGTTITLNETEVKLDTDRFTRGQFNGLFATIGNTTVNWKFGRAFLTIGISEVKQIIFTINNYVQEHFDWEKEIWEEIDLATSMMEFKSIKEKIINR